MHLDTEFSQRDVRRTASGVLDARGRLAQAEQRWAAQKVSSYDFSIRIRCFCVFPQALSFQVRDGTSSAPGLDAATRARVAQFESIDALFLLLHQCLEENPGRFEVEYEPSMGYPTRADLDLILRAADDELRFDVTDFRLLR